MRQSEPPEDVEPAFREIHRFQDGMETVLERIRLQELAAGRRRKQQARATGGRSSCKPYLISVYRLLCPAGRSSSACIKMAGTRSRIAVATSSSSMR
jgi:hypothetical protein